MFKPNWTEISNLSYIEKASNAKAIWLGNVIIKLELNNNTVCVPGFPFGILEGIFRVTDTKTRQCSLDSCDQWDNFISTCYSLSCIPREKTWEDKNARKESFKDWMVTHKIRDDPHFFRFDRNKFTDDTIITIFDTNKQRRLIVDGFHRASALTIACGEKIDIPDIRIFESYGYKLNVIFPCDAYQL